MYGKCRLKFHIAALAGCVVAIGWSCQATAEEVFRGGTLTNTFPFGILTSATKRGDGSEVLRIRANTESLKKIIEVDLPVTTGQPRDDFTLTIAPPLFSGKPCGALTDSKSSFEDCFSKPSQPLSTWDWVQLPPLADGIINLAFRSKSVDGLFAQCGYLPEKKVLLTCNMYFDQNGHWHELATSAQAFDHPELFYCSAFRLRNAVWGEAPPLPTRCEKKP